MAAERDLELLDDYLANRLDEKAQSAFEQQLATDPDLKSEFELQQQFIHGIKKARTAELKAMLNNVPVPALPSQGTALASKVAIWSTLAGIVGAGLYLYLKQTDKTVTVPENNNPTEQPQEQGEDMPSDASKEEEAKHSHDVSPVVSGEGSSSEEKPVELPKAIRKKKEEPVKDRIKVYDPSKEENGNQPARENDKPVFPQATVSNIVVDVDSENKKYGFHYQFKGGKLFLYGPFEKNLYEILEFFGEDKRTTLFLFYKDEYYLLKDDSQALRPLNPIRDTALLKKLKESRN